MWEEYESMLENDMQQILTLDGVERWRKEGEKDGSSEPWVLFL